MSGQVVRQGLAVSGLHLRRGGRAVVDDVSLTVAPGEMVALWGPSGSGKTSVLSIIAGMTRPESGTVLMAGGPVDASRLGVVLQGYGLVPVLTAAENVEVVLQARGVAPSDVGRRAAAALERVGADGLGERLVERLSGGQQQRVAIARALVHEPDLLLADEPTSELDEALRDRVVDELRQEARRGAVVVLATHDDAVVAVCDRALHVADGRLAASR